MMRVGKGRLIVRPEKQAETSEAGLLIPEGSRERPDRGTVVAVGEGSAWAAGETVLYPRFLGFETVYQGETLVVLHEDEILFAEG